MSNQNHKSMTWLIVEDDYAIRDIISTMCELWNFEVVTLKDGHEATKYLQQEFPPLPHPDVALVDIRMPGPWGHEIAAKLRQHPALNNIGVILMTAYELPGEDEEEYLSSSGADELLYKPLPPMDDLLELVKDVLKRRRAASDV